MEVSVIQIGNSKGIRLNKQIIEQYEIKDTLDMTLSKGQIILKPVTTPRKGWDEQFKEMTGNGDDILLMDDVFEDEEFEEWS